MNQSGRMRREARTIGAMIDIYCRDKHNTGSGLCPECNELVAYAGKRLEKCPWQEEKPTCTNCSIHCYDKTMRDRVRVVMRYAGPRMLLRHPVLALLHLLDGRKATPQRETALRRGRAT